MDPSYDNSFGSFSSGAGQAPVVSSGGDVVVGNQPAKKNKKWLLLIVAAVFLVGVSIAAVVFAFQSRSNNSTQEQIYSREELYSDMWDFYYEHYQDLAIRYGLMVGDSSVVDGLGVEEDVEISSVWLEWFESELKEAIEAFNKLPESSLGSYETTKGKIGEALLAIEENVAIIKEFYGQEEFTGTVNEFGDLLLPVDLAVGDALSLLEELVE